MGDVPVEVLCSPLGVEPSLVQVAWCYWCGYVCMGLDALLKVLPHVEYYAAVVPPVKVVLFCFVKILFPSIHRWCVLFIVMTGIVVKCHHACMSDEMT